MPWMIKDLTGKRFGRLVVIDRNPENTSTRTARWNCLCDCGSKCVAIGVTLTRGTKQSCGCLQKERTSEANRTHGMSKTAEYNIWCGLIARCFNQNDPAYYKYGGRGITVCKRWLNSFMDFYQDIGPRPGPEYSVDRYPNNDGNYEPGNCRWATPTEQANNTRSNRIVELNNTQYTIAELARELSIPAKTIHSRLSQGKELDNGLLSEVHKVQTYTVNGKTLTVPEWSSLLGVDAKALRYRLNNGWPLDKVFTSLTGPKVHSFNGGLHTLREIAELVQIPYWKLHQRMNRDKMTLEEAVKNK